ncbi:MAG: glucose-6-phosphate isomerase [Gammaproteobacteria bacterium]
MPGPFKPNDAPVWPLLAKHRRAAQRFSLPRLFEQEPDRFERMHCSAAGLTLDYSRSLATAETVSLLLQAAEAVQLRDRIEALFGGGEVNPTEGRAALHTSLRDAGAGTPHRGEIEEVQRRIASFAVTLRAGGWIGATGRPVTDLVNLGIGGSDLGPRMVTAALHGDDPGRVRCHFVSNIDGADLAQVLAGLAPETTLFIISSKSFSTLETLQNAAAARQWLSGMAGREEDYARHLVAVTANPGRATEFGIPEDNIFPLWDWVGGRYSLWSAVGLPIVVAAGVDNFNELRAGAAAMDEHFRQAPFGENLPVLLGMLGIWYLNYWNATSYAVLPYLQRLRLFPDFLQQLEMESNGKSMRTDSRAVDYDTAPVVWGSVETNGQHSFHQLLHQGTRFVPVEFIAALEPGRGGDERHPWVLASCLGQARALMTGKTREEAREELLKEGKPEDEADRLAPHKAMPGNRPSNLILLERLDPRHLGALIALYEHKVYVQSVVWHTNAFDQYGVELGKVLGKRIHGALTGGDAGDLDPATRGVIDLYKKKYGK